MPFTSSTACEDTSKAMLLDIRESKSASIFAADQTPTPTRLIKNCEEVGLFEDLQHVNPFDETFRRAVEQNADCAARGATQQDTEDTLHTPQVFPQLEHHSGDAVFHSCDLMEKPLGRMMSVDDILVDGIAMPYKVATRQNSASSTASATSTGRLQKPRPIAEKPTAMQSEPVSAPTVVPSAVQVLQPQVITWSFAATGAHEPLQGKHVAGATSAIPIQTVKPFILPKPATGGSAGSAPKQQNRPPALVATANRTVSALPTTPSPVTPPTNEPSSASLTPTAQLPIKERLKAILSNSSNSRIVELPQKTITKHLGRAHTDCVERRRAASTRYRIKMRNEQKELRRRNGELAAENERLRQRVQQLELELQRQQQFGGVSGGGVSVASNVQLPPSTLHLVMNIPRILVHAVGQPTLQHPITYAVEKK